MLQALKNKPTLTEDSQAAVFDHQTGTFFRRIDWIATWATFLIVLGSYLLTLAPTVTLEDSGELSVAPDYLGVPHPPGYPSWSVFSWFFQWIFGWVKYYGHPNPAWGVALASAVAGAGACAILALLVSRSATDMLRSIRLAGQTLSYRFESYICGLAGISSGLLLAWSPVMWSQSVIVEVYALNAFFQMLVILFLYRWMSRPTELKSLYILCFLFGLGITNHQTLMFMGLALATGVLLRDLRLFRDFAIVGGGLVLVFALNRWCASQEPALPNWFDGPNLAAVRDFITGGGEHTLQDFIGFWGFSALALLTPILGLLLPRGRTVCIAIYLTYLGLAFYLYMPISSDQNPPINWGYPRTWEGFIHAITRGQYERISPADIFSLKFLNQVGTYFTDLRNQFTLPVVIIGFLTFCGWNVQWGPRRHRLFLAALALAAIAIPLIWLQTILTAAETPLHQLIERGVKWFLILPILLIGLGGVLAMGLRCARERIGHFRAWQNPRGTPLKEIASVGPASFDLAPAQQVWLLTTAIAFLSVSVVFIAFQNLETDLQNLFIGRVQFIQSHALFAIWLGYGLAFLLANFEMILRREKTVRWVGLAIALFCPLILVYQNYFDKQQIKEVGGAEQNGHDFGWQFGHWQLQGYEGIKADFLYRGWTEDLAKYPCPGYPPVMGTNAIFFGGTDPGRFVPTYMLYCARVRPDVYLITQNALADNTYMNTMRDLYGDTIWIPTMQDTNVGFQRYVADIQSGRIEAGAEVVIKNGRVMVNGVMGVMAINGLLCKMIHDHNKDRHDFYVEESYVIPWMYPYLEPHGMILKLNREPLQELSPEVVKNDRLFWDWYTQRSLANPKFLRDVVARKTFAKLRSAIAGVYVFRGMTAEAEYAFKQALALYPLTPESTFRLADLYIQNKRFPDAIAIVHQFLAGDPKNSRMREFSEQLVLMEADAQRIVALEKIISTGTTDLNQAIELATLYQKSGRRQQFDEYFTNLVETKGLPRDFYINLAKLAANSQRGELLLKALLKVSEIEPGNAQVWLDIAGTLALLQRDQEAVEHLRKAIALGSERIRGEARRDHRFDRLRMLPAFQALVPPVKPLQLPSGMPGLPAL